MKLKKIVQYFAICTLLMSFLVACSSDDNSSITRENKRVKVESYTLMKPIEPFKGQDVEHLILYAMSGEILDYTPSIEGFKYEEGYTYVLDITRIHNKELMDSNFEYVLVKLISKEKKE